MVDWTRSMQQTFEYYIVDPGTWTDIRRINTVTSSSISRDSSADTLGSASINMTESIGECYIRIYLITIQNGIREKHPLGTFIIQTPSYSFDGKINNVSVDAYTPLLELKENQPPLGYFAQKGLNIVSSALTILREQVRAPIVATSDTKTLHNHFVATTDDTWITFVRDLLADANMSLGLDEMSRVILTRKQDVASLQPVWTFDDSNSSILYPELDIEHDLYGIPNIVEVVYSNGTSTYYGIAINDDPNSPTSTVNRGRKITYRITDPGLPGISSETQIQQYAKQVLKSMSTIEYTITYKHGYCPVRLGDCVRLNYKNAGLNGVKAQVIKQDITCTPGCPVTEKAVFTNSLWGGI